MPLPRLTSVNALVQNSAISCLAAYSWQMKSRTSTLSNERKYYEAFFQAADKSDVWKVENEFKLSRRTNTTRGALPSVDFVVHNLKIDLQKSDSNTVVFRDSHICAFEICMPVFRRNDGRRDHPDNLARMLKDDEDKLRNFTSMLDRSKGLRTLEPRATRNRQTVKFKNLRVSCFFFILGHTVNIYHSALVGSNDETMGDVCSNIVRFFRHRQPHASLPTKFSERQNGVWGISFGIPDFQNSDQISNTQLANDSMFDYGNPQRSGAIPSRNHFSVVVNDHTWNSGFSELELNLP